MNSIWLFFFLFALQKHTAFATFPSENAAAKVCIEFVIKCFSKVLSWITSSVVQCFTYDLAVLSLRKKDAEQCQVLELYFSRCQKDLLNEHSYRTIGKRGWKGLLKVIFWVQPITYSKANLNELMPMVPYPGCMCVSVLTIKWT